MELKDIVLKKGDIVYYTFNEGKEYYIIIDSYNNKKVSKLLEECFYNGEKITKIERVKEYETIYEAPKEILDKEEKEWLENFLRPFRDRVISINKVYCNDSEWLEFTLKEGKDVSDNFSLPSFEKDTMYKGMELEKKYTLKKLGLFKGEKV